ncbi:hypothetical protein [Candidatus Parabeggiatoa sp. HSG14]|uniref:hypothetical protein n=1 Tax=Candidatus Parabeggiatoa sp. HSG14 TaxID=3055593 RepID=UPI0025A778A6|nr:hypothetical protein [Thiotrichales bacterium HSG14]
MVLVGSTRLHIVLPANFVLLSDLAAGEERCYPDETFRPCALLQVASAVVTQDNKALKRTIYVLEKCRLTARH